MIHIFPMIHLRRAALAAIRAPQRRLAGGHWGQSHFEALRGAVARVQAPAPVRANTFHTCSSCAAAGDGNGDPTGGKNVAPEDILCVVATALRGFRLTGPRRRTLMGQAGVEDDSSAGEPLDPAQLGIDLENMDEDEVRALVEVRDAPPGGVPHADCQLRSALPRRTYRAW